MEELIQVIQKYGVEVSLLGVIGSVLIGIIKTPIRELIFRKDFEDIGKVENIFDTTTFLFTFVMAVINTTIFLKVKNNLTLQTVFPLATQVWLVQNIVYGIWKKFGLKRLVEGGMDMIRKKLDKDKNNKISFAEALEGLNSLVTSGTIDLSSLLKIIEKQSNGTVERVYKKALESVGKVKEVVDTVSEKVDKVKEVMEEVEISKEATKEIKKSPKKPTSTTLRF